MFDLFMVLLVSFVMLSQAPIPALQTSDITTVTFRQNLNLSCFTESFAKPAVMLLNNGEVIYSSSQGDNEHGSEISNNFYLTLPDSATSPNLSIFLPQLETTSSQACKEAQWEVEVSSPSIGQLTTTLDKEERYYVEISL